MVVFFAGIAVLAVFAIYCYFFRISAKNSIARGSRD
jgi:hypothetical protein